MEPVSDSLPVSFLLFIDDDDVVVVVVVCVPLEAINSSSCFLFENEKVNEKKKQHFFDNLPIYSILTQPAKLQKKQCGGVYFCVYGTAFSMPIQQKLPPPELLFSDFAGGVWCYGLKHKNNTIIE